MWTTEEWFLLAGWLVFSLLTMVPVAIWLCQQ